MSELTLAVVVRRSHGLGFRLAGARVYEVGEQAAALAEVVEDRTLGVLAIEEELVGRLPRTLVERASRGELPIVVPFAIPRWAESGRAEEYVGLLLRRAIGYRVKILR
jgi:vacuolar-type H+-ATPase subunit F/Vma7